MSSRREDEENIKLLFKLIFMVVLVPVHAIGYPIKMLATRYLRNTIEDLLEYQTIQAERLKLLSVGTMILAFLPAYWAGLSIIVFFANNEQFQNATLRSGTSAILGALACFLALIAYAVAKSIYALLDTPAFEMKLKGHEAECTVSKYLAASFLPQNGWRVFNDCLFVFNRDQPNEWSAEVDHIVVGGRAIFLVETKYKSGTIYADPHADLWNVTRFDRSSTMRNALKQSQNSARALQQHLGISGANFIPVVAFVGTDTAVVGGPSNVVHFADSANVIISIDNTIEYRGMSHDQAVQTIERTCVKDAASMKRHILRAKAKTVENERKKIFENAVF